MEIIFTEADLEAHYLLLETWRISTSTHDRTTPIDSGNRIIELAEKIKAQRLGKAMQK